MCACGKSQVETLTTNQAQALIDAARDQAMQAALSETEAMVASAAKAMQNANSGASTLR